jgi:hypothetical protein
MDGTKKYETVEQALSQTALETIANMQVEDFVGHLKQRGITSLEDLAKASIGVAKSGIAGPIRFMDPEDFPVCYKFTVRPFVSQARDLGTVLDKVKTANIGR